MRSISLLRVGIIFAILLAPLGLTTPVSAATASDSGSTLSDKTVSLAPSKTGKFRRAFYLSFEPTAIAGMAEVRKQLIDDGFVYELLDAMSQEIRLPRNIPVTFKDCGYANAFWDPGTQSVTYCYELIDLYRKGYEQVQDEASAFLS